MKHSLLSILTLAMLTACQTAVDEPTRSGVDVQTSISQEAISRATLSSICKHLNAIVVDGDGAIVSQISNDATTASIGFDLDAGDYTLLLIANAGNAPTINTDATATFTKAGDCFSYSNAFTVARDKRTSISAAMDRCVAKLTFNSTDAVPTAASKVNIKLENISTTYDIDEAKGTNSASYEANGVAVSSYKQSDGTFSCYVYALLPDASITNGKLSLTFLDASGNELYSPSWSDLPLTINRNTVLSAPMFHENGADATITINADWGEDITVDR